jgi:hypothetical protein
MGNSSIRMIYPFLKRFVQAISKNANKALHQTARAVDPCCLVSFPLCM